MNIVLATDDYFVQHCSVVINSLLSNNIDAVIYILTEGLSGDNTKYLNKLVSGLGGNLIIMNVPSSIVQKFPMSALASGHISIATYYRLFVTSLLPETVDKIIYMDCDIVVRGSLKELWETPLEEYAIGAVYQDLGWSDYNMSWERLKIPRKEGYFNAGVLLMNLKYLRKMDFEEKAITFINENHKRIISHDQDVLNSLLYSYTLPLSPKWNYIPMFLSKRLFKLEFPQKFIYRLNDVKRKDFTPVVVHFVSTPKPWAAGCSHPYKSEYYKYLDQNKWHFEEPKSTFNTWVKYQAIPSLRDIVLYADVFELAQKRKHKKIKENCDLK